MDINDIRRENLLDLMKKFRTQQEFADRVDTATAYLSQIKKGTTPAGRQVKIGDELARKVEEKLGLQKGWLDRQHSREPLQNVEPVEVKITKLPVLSLVQAGSWTGVESIQGHEIAEYENALREHKDGHYYLRVTGMSNYPFYLEGDLVEINPLVEFDRVQTGQMVIMRCHGEATFKMLVREGSKTYLRALNKDFTPQFIEIDCDCTFVGVMEGLYRKPMRHHMQI